MPTRRRKTAQPTTHPTPPAPAADVALTHDQPPADRSDVFDRVIADRVATATPADARPGTTTPDSTASQAAYQPDPFPFLSVAVGEGADAPRVRLFRNRRMNQVAVRFDEKPTEPHRQRLREAGYKWRDAEGVWTKQLGDERASGQLAAERLVSEIADAIRGEAGLPLVGRAEGR